MARTVTTTKVWTVVGVLVLIYGIPSLPSEAQPWRRVFHHVTPDLISAAVLLLGVGIIVWANWPAIRRRMTKPKKKGPPETGGNKRHTPPKPKGGGDTNAGVQGNNVTQGDNNTNIGQVNNNYPPPAQPPRGRLTVTNSSFRNNGVAGILTGPDGPDIDLDRTSFENNGVGGVVYMDPSDKGSLESTAELMEKLLQVPKDEATGEATEEDA
jgi:hypothetical protein